MVQNIKCKTSLKLRVFRVDQEGQTTAKRKRTKGQAIQQPKEKGQKDKQCNSPKKMDKRTNNTRAQRKRTKGQTTIYKHCI